MVFIEKEGLGVPDPSGRKVKGIRLVKGPTFGGSKMDFRFFDPQKRGQKYAFF